MLAALLWLEQILVWERENEFARGTIPALFVFFNLVVILIDWR